MAGILAAVAALVLHFLHVVEADVLLMITLVLMALLFLRDLRRERQDEQLLELAHRTEADVASLVQQSQLPDVVLAGPGELGEVSARFSRHALGEMVWFNVCLLMFRPQSLFDQLLLPAIQNPKVTRIRFVLDEGERDAWAEHVVPKARAAGAGDKLVEPQWGTLRESVSFILSEREPNGDIEALLSFWGEPFMSHTTTRQVPRYIFHVQGHSELIERLRELEREQRFST